VGASLLAMAAAQWPLAGAFCRAVRAEDWCF